MNDRRVALVTGGSRGIGRAIVRRLVRDGYFVAFNYVRGTEAAEALVRELGPDKVTACRCDVVEYEPVKAMVDDVVSRYGRVDVLVSNAGVTRDKTLMMMSPEDWREVISVNLTGAFNASKAVIVPMLKAKQGRIVYLSSVTGLVGMKGQVNYAASKAGLIGMTKALAKEVAGYGITVNVVAPGFIEGDMTAQMGGGMLAEIRPRIPQKRLGTAEEVAGLVAYLVSDAAAYITGEVVRIDGGVGI